MQEEHVPVNSLVPLMLPGDKTRHTLVRFGSFMLALVIEATLALHKIGIAHCDLNPGNILLPLLKAEDIHWPYGAAAPKRGDVFVATELKPRSLILIDFSSLAFITAPDERDPCEKESWDAAKIVQLSDLTFTGPMLASRPVLESPTLIDMIKHQHDPDKSCYMFSLFFGGPVATE
mmetsp:Transcript_25001/g.61849  ORF Transcript_25001/g.61849 Transcript_25001/m.61849 type:complete len:176 (-) Transcript_25001:1196-1723(-)